MCMVKIPKSSKSFLDLLLFVVDLWRFIQLLSSVVGFTV